MHKIFEKPKSLLRVMVTIKIMNKIFLFITKFVSRIFSSFWMFSIKEENVEEIGGEGWSLFVNSGLGIFEV
jgi:hypothetical protein